MSGFVGAIVEAWDELRVHKLRVLLSLIGVAVAVTAMTSVTAIGEMMQRVQEQIVTMGGARPATIGVSIWYEDLDVPTDTSGATAAAMGDFIERHNIETAARSAWVTVPMVMDGYLHDVSAQAVDVPWRDLNGLHITAGRWFSPGDSELLAPVVVVNEPLLAAYGHGEWTGPFAIEIRGAAGQMQAVVIGVVPDLWEIGEYEAYVLLDTYQDQILPSDQQDQLFSDLRIWVDPAQADELSMRVSEEIGAALGQGAVVDTYRMDDFGSDDFLATFRLVVSGIGLLILGLSALNLINIAIVTLRQRVREIGVRRALGASAGRIFFAVMLESVVATALAGLVGVIAAIFILRLVPMDWLIGGLPGVQMPGFPISAAIIGLVAATVVGALSGLIPAMMAVNIRPINAIRY